MTEETMRLSAEVVDKFSAPLKRLRAALNDVQSPAGAKKLTNDFTGVGNAAFRAGQKISNDFSMALSAVGVAGLGAATGLTAATAAAQRFASRVLEMRALSKETGIAVDQLRALSAVAPRFGVSADAMQGSLSKFAETAYDFRRQMGPAYNEILKVAPDLAEKIQKSSPGKALDSALSFIARTPDRITAKRISEILFGTDDIARLTSEGIEPLKRALADAMARLGHSLDPAKAAKYADAMQKIRERMDNLGMTAGLKLAPAMTTVLDKLDKFAEQRGERIASGVSSAFDATVTSIEALDKVISNSVGWQTVIGGTLALRFIGLGNAASGAVWSIRALIAVISAPAALAALGALAAISVGRVASNFGATGPEAYDKSRMILRRNDVVKELSKTRRELDGLGPDDPRRGALLAKEAQLKHERDELSRKIEGGVKKGAAEGVKEGLREQIEKMALRGGGGDGKVYQASYGGGGVPNRMGGGLNPGAVSRALERARELGGATPDSGGGGVTGRGQIGGVTAHGFGGGSPHVGGGGSSPAMRAGRAIGGKLAALGAARYRLSGAEKSEMAGSIRASAAELGVSPEHLAAVLSFETGGTMDPWKAGPTTRWGQHRGLIQWGEPQAQKYGVSKSSTISQQMQAATRYLRDRGVNPGMGIEHLYAAVLAGRASDAVLDRRDANGTSPRSGAYAMWHSGHRNALANLEAGTAYRAAQRAGVVAPPAASPSGKASLDVTLHGFPAGWKARAEGGGLFKEIEVNKGRSMPLAGPGG